MLVTPIPGGIRVGHIGISVPDLAAAHTLFTEVLGCECRHRLGPFEAPRSSTTRRRTRRPSRRWIHFDHVDSVISKSEAIRASVPPG